MTVPRDGGDGSVYPPSVRFYVSQSRLTSPGIWRRRLHGLPKDVPGLCSVVQGLIVHYRTPAIEGYRLPRGRRGEVNLRYAEQILARIFERNPGPLTEARLPSERVAGCCRDFALLFCTLSRYQGFPSRVRVGFSTYFRQYPPGFRADHTVAEIWDERSARWRLVDPEQSEELARRNQLSFSATDVPRDRFLTGGQAWSMCRREGADSRTFGVQPGVPPRGLWFVRSRMLHDLAALNRCELLLWDSWTPAGRKFIATKHDLLELDAIALALGNPDPSLTEARRYFRSRRWRVPRVVRCFSPVGPPFRHRLEVAA